jgi:hypothetical protein
VRFFAFPVVVRSGLGNAVVKTLFIKFIEIGVEHEIGGDSKEEVPQEEHSEPEGSSGSCHAFEENELKVSGDNKRIIVQASESIPHPDDSFEETEL